MNRILKHMRANIVAYVALFIALGGTSYAAISVPNHSITPVKLNRQSIGGYIRAWASVDANGHVAAGSPGVWVVVNRSGIPGIYAVLWQHQKFAGCVPETGVRGASNTTPGFALAESLPSAARRGQVNVGTIDSHGSQAALPFYISVLCRTP
jgi:hypothetical protein